MAESCFFRDQKREEKEIRTKNYKSNWNQLGAHGFHISSTTAKLEKKKRQ